MSEACPGCGLVLAPHDGPTHEYIGASPACWALYGTVLEREYSNWDALGPTHYLSVDAYATQHPGVECPKAIRSVAIHLITLHRALEGGGDERALAHSRKVSAAARADYHWLVPPSFRGCVTVADVAAASSNARHIALITDWAHSVYEAWSNHHDTIRRWSAAI